MSPNLNPRVGGGETNFLLNILFELETTDESHQKLWLHGLSPKPQRFSNGVAQKDNEMPVISTSESTCILLFDEMTPICQQPDISLGISTI